MNINVTSLAVIVVYMVVVTVIGSLLARRTKSSRDWAVAGGGMSAFMVAVGIAGTRIGGAGTYGVAGNVMSGGVWYGWWYGINTFLALAIVGFFFARPYRRLKLQTVGEIFTIRFGTRRNQALTSFCVQTEYMIVNIIEAYVIGVMLVGLTGMPMSLGVLIAAAVLITYTALGGLWGSAFTNMIHCSVILVGLLTVSLMGIQQMGGWEEVRTAVDQHLAGAEKNARSWWAFAGAGWLAVLGMFFSASVHTPAASVYTNFSTAAKEESHLPGAFCLGGVIGAFMPFFAGLIGIVTLAKYGYVSVSAGYENITKVAEDINPVIGGLALAAVLAAVISSGGPILLSSATMFVRDWLPFTRDYSADRKLVAYRTTTLIYGLFAAAAAWAIREYTEISILDLLLFGFAMVVPPAVAVGYLIYWPRTTEKGAYWGMLTGYVGGLIWFVAIKWALHVEAGLADGEASPFTAYPLVDWAFTHKGVGIDPSYLTTLVPLAVVPIVSLFGSDMTDGKEPFYARLRGTTPVDDAPDSD